MVMYARTLHIPTYYLAKHNYLGIYLEMDLLNNVPFFQLIQNEL